jgi:hypothetical protein
MRRFRAKNILMFILGMLTFAVGSFIVTTFIIVERPVKEGIIEDWDQICFWPDADGFYLSISPRGCYSSSCTRPKLQTSTAMVDVQKRAIQLEARFVLQKTSRFPLPCTEDCSGGTVQFKLDQLLPNEYEVWFKDERVGNLNIFSGRPTPRQCFESTLSNSGFNVGYLSEERR